MTSPNVPHLANNNAANVDVLLTLGQLPAGHLRGHCLELEKLPAEDKK